MERCLFGFHLAVRVQLYPILDHAPIDFPGGHHRTNLQRPHGRSLPISESPIDWICFFLYDSDSPPNLNRWDSVQYQFVRRDHLGFYRDPFNFRKSVIDRKERMLPVPVPPADGRFGYNFLYKKSPILILP